MSGSEWAAVVASQVCLLLVVILVVMIVRLDRAAKDLRRAANDFRAEAEPAMPPSAMVETTTVEPERTRICRT